MSTNPAHKLADLAAQLTELAAQVVGSPPCRPAVQDKGPLTRSGLRKRSRTFGVDTYVAGHKVRKGGFPTEAAAAEWLYKVRTDRRALEAYLRQRLDGPRVTVADAIAFYLDKRGNGKRTADQMQRYAERIGEFMGSRAAAAVRQCDVDGYASSRKASEKTVHNELCFLRTALRYAWRCDKLHAPPNFGLSPPDCARTRVAEPDEAKGLLEAADLPLRRVLLGLYTMGLRRGEVLEMRWSWVNRTTREATLPRSSTKTKRERVAVFPPGLWELLQQDPVHPEFVFARWYRGKNGKAPWQEPARYWVTTLQREFRKLRKAVGVSNLHLHDLRRSMSSVAQERGHTPRAVQSVGGWQDVAVFQKNYTHPSRRAVRAVAEDLERVLLGSPAQAPEGTSQIEAQLLAAIRGVLGGRGEVTK